MKTGSNEEQNYTLRNPPPNGWTIDHIEKLRQLPGHLNRVHLAQLKSSQEQFVLKKLSKKEVYPPFSSLLLEKELHLSANHPNVISIYGYFETGTAVYIMMEFAEEGDLFNVALNRKDEHVVAKYLRQVALGLKYLHEMGVVHRDLKAENVVVSNSNECKIIDFGFAAKLPLGGSIDGGSPAGTLEYLSPEVVWGLSYDHCSDIWSYGVLSYILLCGHYPFAPIEQCRRNDREPYIIKAILEGNVFKGNSFKKNSFWSQDFINRLLVKSPGERMTLCEILKHPFLNLHSSILNLSPSEERPSFSTSSPSSMSSDSARPFIFEERGEDEE